MFLLKFLTHLYLAVTFLTRLPLPIIRRQLDQSLADSAYCFAIVGALIGALVAGFVWLLQVLGLTELTSAVLVVAFTALVTGALHEDGLADCCDGFGGGHNRERKLEIMKDSRIGTYGVLALVLGALLKVALLAPLMEGDLLPLALIVVAVHSLSRSSMPVLMAYTAPAKTSGVASKAGKVTVSNAGLGLGLSLLFIWISLGFGPALWASVLCFVVLTIWAWISQRQVGGHTGDTLGALQQIIEIALLALFTSYLGS